MLGLEPERRTVMVTGGSQGALHLDQVVAAALPSFAERGDLQLLIVTGPGRESELAGAAERAGAARVVGRAVPRSDGARVRRRRSGRGARGRDDDLGAGGLRAAVDPGAVSACDRAPSGRERAGVGARRRRGARARRRAHARRLRDDGARRSWTTRTGWRPWARGRPGGRSRTPRTGSRPWWRRPSAHDRAPTTEPRYTPPPGSIPTLDVPSLDGVARLHLIGIGGAGMRNLAKLLLARGIAVSGSDLKDSKGLAELRDLGADVDVGHDPAHVRDPTPTPSSSRARSAIGTSSWSRRAVVTSRCGRAPRRSRRSTAGKRSIAVAGTHGKTTTTSMVAVVLEGAGLDPSFLVGGDLNESGSGARSGDGRPVRLRGGRERRFVPAGVASDRHRDERGRRPRRLLSGRARRDRGGVRGVHDAMRERGRVWRRPGCPLGRSNARVRTPSPTEPDPTNDWTLVDRRRRARAGLAGS